MSTILALDSSSENCSVAILHDGRMSLNSKHAPRKHTQLMLPLMQEELKNRALELNDIEAIAFGCGPGSFTGIRIAAGVAQGLAFGLDVPIYAISNLKALALQSYLKYGETKVLACIDARMDEVYWGLFEVISKNQRDSASQSDTNAPSIKYYVNSLIDEQVTAPADVETQLLAYDLSQLCAIGSGLEFLTESTLSAFKAVDSKAQPDSDTIAFLADTAEEIGLSGALSDALPSYVRDTVTWNKLPGRE